MIEIKGRMNNRILKNIQKWKSKLITYKLGATFQ